MICPVQFTISTGLVKHLQLRGDSRKQERGQNNLNQSIFSRKGLDNWCMSNNFETIN